MPQDRLFDIWFSLRAGIANREFAAVLDQYGSTYPLFNADPAELDQLSCSARFRTALADKSLDEAYRIKSYCERAGVHLLFWQDKEYPASLRTLLDPPVLLYCMGKLPDFAKHLCISIVGTRTMSEYGKRMAYKIGYELAAAGVVPVSGMALGCDGVATAGALAAGGHPVAVLGSGIDIAYPSGHLTLYRALSGQGTVLTEYPPGTPPEGRHFPVRNRIISGLSQGTVVVEADEHSGALITARTAILQGRDIFAVPGNVGETNSSGTNALLRDGASMVLGARDILDAYAFLYRDDLNWVGLTRAEPHSEPNDAVLLRYGVQTRTISSRDQGTRQAGVNRPIRRAAPDGTLPQRDGRTVQPADVPVPETPVREPETPPATVPVPEGDCSGQVLETLSETQRAVFLAMPLDHAVPVDALMREGFSMGDVLAAMTVLEIKGLIASLPGGLYARR